MGSSIRAPTHPELRELTYPLTEGDHLVALWKGTELQLWGSGVSPESPHELPGEEEGGADQEGQLPVRDLGNQTRE